jgi:hypothetical protein
MTVLTIKLLNSFSHYHVSKKNFIHHYFSLSLSFLVPVPFLLLPSLRVQGVGLAQGVGGDVAAWVHIVAVAAGRQGQQVRHECSTEGRTARVRA